MVGESAPIVKASHPERTETPFGQTISAAVDELVRCNDLARSSVAVYVEHWTKFLAFAGAKGYRRRLLDRRQGGPGVARRSRRVGRAPSGRHSASSSHFGGQVVPLPPSHRGGI